MLREHPCPPPQPDQAQDPSPPGPARPHTGPAPTQQQRAGNTEQERLTRAAPGQLQSSGVPPRTPRTPSTLRPHQLFAVAQNARHCTGQTDSRYRRWPRTKSKVKVKSVGEP